MNLYILRHGIAVDRDPKSFPDDSTRPLTLKGEDRIRLVCDAMQALELSFDHILSSPFRRAHQTADIIAASLGMRRELEFRDELKPESEPQALIRYLKKLKPDAENVLLVGHEPYLGALASTLISGSAEAEIDWKKGGLGKLEITAPLRYGKCATLAWLLTPKQLALLA